MKYLSVLLTLMWAGCAGPGYYSPPSLSAVEAGSAVKVATDDAIHGFKGCTGDSHPSCTWNYDMALAYLHRADGMVSHWDEVGSQGQFRCLMKHLQDPLTQLAGPNSKGVLVANRLALDAPEKCAP